jgi:shikimate 5-dehydrogenase
MSERSQRLSRRHFLLTLGAGGAATAAAVATQRTSPAAPATSTNKRAARGYQASAHVNNYYRTTKV